MYSENVGRKLFQESCSMKTKIPSDYSYKNSVDDITSWATTNNWRVSQNKDGNLTWRTFSNPLKPLKKTGWKIHISVSSLSGAAVIKAALREVSRFLSAFKMAEDEDSIFIINSGSAGSQQVGKIFTLYPISEEVIKLAVNCILSLSNLGDGPEIVSDIKLNPSGTLGIRYGSFCGAHTIVDQVGRVIPAMETADGPLKPDLRSHDGQQNIEASEPPISGWLADDLTAPVYLPSATWIPMALISSGAKGNIRLALRNAAPYDLCFLKLAKRGVSSSRNGYDATSLLQREYNIQNLLYGLGFPCSQILDYKVSESITLLVTSDLRGKTLSSFSPSSARVHLPKICRIIAQLHSLGFVHRDIKPENILVTETDICLIDFELSCRIGEKNPPSASSFGYYHPRVKDDYVSRDLYALAMIIAWAWLESAPGLRYNLITYPSKLLHLHGHIEQSRWVNELLTGRMEEKNIEQIAIAIETYLQAEEKPKLLSKPRGKIIPRNLYGDVLNVLQVYRFAQDEGGIAWRNGREEGDLFNESIYRGASGVILSLLTMDELSASDRNRTDIEAACLWLRSRLVNERSGGFFTGNAGVALTLAVVGTRYRDKKTINSSFRYFEQALVVKGSAPDLFFGDAGILWAGVLLEEILETKKYDLALDEIAKGLVSKLNRKNYVYGWQATAILNKSTKCSYGAAHGASGIAMALRSWAMRRGDSSTVALCDDIFFRIFKYARTSDNRQIESDESNLGNSYAAHIWCHGLGGYLWCILQGEQRPEKLDDAIQWCANRLINAPASGSTSYCHGISGRLEILRMMSALPRYSEQALKARNQCAAAICLSKITIKGKVNWPCEDGELISPELWNGFLAPMSALALDDADVRAAMMSSKWLKRLSQG
jgi:hypothetical protein